MMIGNGQEMHVSCFLCKYKPKTLEKRLLLTLFAFLLRLVFTDNTDTQINLYIPRKRNKTDFFFKLY